MGLSYFILLRGRPRPLGRGWIAHIPIVPKDPQCYNTSMDIYRAYKYRFYPTKDQEVLLAKSFGCARLVYNRFLALRNQAYQDHKINVSYVDAAFLLTLDKQKEELSFLKEVPAVVLQQSLRNADTAYQNFFKKKAQYPRFKSKGNRQSIRFLPNGFVYDGKYSITLAKMDLPLKIKWSRTIPRGAKVKSVTVSKETSGRYFISFLCEDSVAPLPNSDKSIGMDWGLKDFVTTSDGEKVTAPKYYRRSEKKLAKAQRDLSRKEKGSKNRQKARVKVAKAYAKVANQRKDFLHKLSSTIVHENQVICIEDIAVKNLSRNRHLSKSIMDSGWGEFVRQLEYKSQWSGRSLVKVGRFFPSSKTCSHCGCVKDHLDLSERSWTCSECGVVHDRDYNASVNIKAEGTSVLARGEESSGSLVVGPVSETVLCEAGIPVL